MIQNLPSLAGVASTEVDVEVRVDGVVRPVSSWSLTRDCGAEIPAAITGHTLSAATGKITWAEQRTITTDRESPFRRVAGWPPMEGARVTIDVIRRSTNTSGQIVEQKARKFTGKIESTTGGDQDPLVSQIIDDIDRLRQDVVIPPLQWNMPSAALGRRVPIQLSATTPAQQALRMCGYAPSTPMTWRTRVLFGGDGTLAPWVGTLAKPPASGAEGVLSETYSSIWGPAVAVPRDSQGLAVPVAVSGQVDGSMPAPQWLAVDMPGLGRDPRTKPARSTVTVAGPWSGYFRVARDFAKNQIGVIATDQPDAFDNLNVLTVPAGQDITAYLKITSSGGTVTALLRTSVTGTQEMPATRPADTSKSTVTVSAWEGVLGQIQYRDGGWSWPLEEDPAPTMQFHMARYGPYGTLGRSEATPELSGSALSIISDAAKAMCALIWIDELGVFHWADAANLNEQGITTEFKSSLDLLGVTWNDSVTRYSRVDIKYSDPAITTTSPGTYTGAQAVPVWQGNASALGPGDSTEDWVKPDTTEDWIGVMDPILSTSGVMSSITKQGQRSLVGGQVVDKDGKSGQWPDPSWLSYSWQRMGRLSTWKLSQTCRLPSGWQITQKIPDAYGAGTGGVALKTRDGWNLPQIVALGKTVWQDVTLTGTIFGPSGAPTYTHECGRWIQYPNHAQALHDFLAPRLTQPYPTVESVTVDPNLAVQIGDKVRFTDPDVLGVSVEGVVAAEQWDGAPGSLDQKLSLWVTKITTPAVTYDRVQGWYRDFSYGDIDSMQAAMTYGAVDNTYSYQTFGG